MKRLIFILLTTVLTFAFLTGCDLFPKKEGQIVFSLEEERESACVWDYFIEPEGAVEKVRDEIYESDDGELYHEWVFEGIAAGEVGITFQYSEQGEDPVRTVHYSCIVDENLHVSLLETEDSADEAGTAADEMLIQCISTAISLQYEQELQYPTSEVSQEYAQAFLACYANMYFSERADEYVEFEGAKLIALDEETVTEILSVAFGSRFGVKMLASDQNSILFSDDVYYILTKDHAWVDTIPLDEELQYVFTLMGETESIDGTAQVTVEETSQNSVGLTLTSLTAQKSE